MLDPRQTLNLVVDSSARLLFPLVVSSSLIQTERQQTHEHVALQIKSTEGEQSVSDHEVKGEEASGLFLPFLFSWCFS